MLTIPLNQIRRDGGTQSRASLDEAAISEYSEKMSSGVQFPAMVVFYDGDTYWLADGFHRAKAYERPEIDEVPCDVRQGTKRDAILHSVGANAQHGVRRSKADKRRSVETLLRDGEWRRWSDRKIADVCGVGRDLVGDVRRELSFTDSPTTEPETRIGADGVERSMPRRTEPDQEPQMLPTRRGPIPEPEDVEGYVDDDVPAPVDAVITPEPEPVSERRPTKREPESEPKTRCRECAHLTDEEIPGGYRVCAQHQQGVNPNRPGYCPLFEPEAAASSDEPSGPIQACADAWNELSQDEQDGFLEAVGAVRFSTLEALARERQQDPEYSVLRRISEPTANSGRGGRMIAAVLDGADWALARLGLTWASTEAEAKRAFRQASLQAHPDRGGSTEEFTAISRANDIVMRWLRGRDVA